MSALWAWAAVVAACAVGMLSRDWRWLAVPLFVAIIIFAAAGREHFR